jgi:hypothetical protein
MKPDLADVLDKASDEKDVPDQNTFLPAVHEQQEKACIVVSVVRSYTYSKPRSANIPST